MRVIAGSARRILLNTVEGMETRPTTDRIKETLFNMLQYEIADTAFLDLYSGSGAIGIEALSRGARKSVFVEKNPKAIECIRENLKKTHLEQNALVMADDVLSALNKLEQKKEPFDYIFMDPPYNHEYEKSVLTYLAKSKLADENTTIIVEASLETDIQYLDELGMYAEKIKTYKTNQHYFIKKAVK